MWRKCAARYEEERGFTFTALYGKALLRHLNKLVDNELGARGVGTLSIENGEVSEWSIEEGLGEAFPTEELIIREAHFDEVLRRLSPNARAALLLSEFPPKEIEEEFKALQMKSQYGRSIGINSRGPVELSLSFVCKYILKLRSEQITAIKRELRSIANDCE